MILTYPGYSSVASTRAENCLPLLVVAFLAATEKALLVATFIIG
jgi:hypothetical protein